MASYSLTFIRWSASAAVALAAACTTAAAQTAPPAGRPSAEQKQSRYQIGVVERVLEGAVEHGVANIRDRLQTLGPTELLINENARARGFRLDGYGVFFDVFVPSFDTSTLWATQTLDRNDLGLDRALRTLQAHVHDDGDPNLQQALKRIELQIAPFTVADRGVQPVAGADAAGSAGAAAEPPGPPAPRTPVAVPPAETSADAIVSDLNNVYRKEVVQALMDAMLDHSSALDIGPSEWLTVAARRNDDRPRLAGPADTDARTFIIRLRGADLAAFLARQITKEEALQRFEVRVF